MELTLGKRLRELSGPVLITGHTGFKGTWLTFLLERLGVPVIGLSLVPEINSLFDRARRTGAIPETFSDIRDLDAVRTFMNTHRPSAVIHMAAQPIVLESYKSPRETFETNVMGTVNVLESSFKTDSVEAIIVVTTDKVYRNDNSGRAFTESDAMAGKDPYSASKVGTEAAVAAWQQISKVSGGPKVLSARAGNVIGGGDWAENRLIPDLIRGFINDEIVRVRNPESNRPWQHVLDPLSGYLMALEAAINEAAAGAFNFGPSDESLTVGQVVGLSEKAWLGTTFVDLAKTSSEETLEAINLQLDSSKATGILGWSPCWDQVEAITSSINWWSKVLIHSIHPVDACKFDIDFMSSRLMKSDFS
jgi:CDP-glucose 4,6-dehydratase